MGTVIIGGNLRLLEGERCMTRCDCVVVAALIAAIKESRGVIGR